MYCFFFEERGEGRERERKIDACAPTGTEPTTQKCVLTGDQTRSLPVYRITLQSTEPHWPGLIYYFFLL